MIDRRQLRKAWPDGYLDVRGVRTVGGWERNAVEWIAPGEQAHEHVARTYSTEELTEVIRKGELLPDVDPADTATWACCLEDLARAAHFVPSVLTSKGIVTGILWGLGSKERSPQEDGWKLAVLADGGELFDHTFYGIDTTDPARALVLARIQIRKEVGR